MLFILIHLDRNNQYFAIYQRSGTHVDLMQKHIVKYLQFLLKSAIPIRFKKKSWKNVYIYFLTVINSREGSRHFYSVTLTHAIRQK